MKDEVEKSKQAWGYIDQTDYKWESGTSNIMDEYPD